VEDFQPHAESCEFVLDHVPFDGDQIPASAGAETAGTSD
jgi:hypothetical protein